MCLDNIYAPLQPKAWSHAPCNLVHVVLRYDAAATNVRDHIVHVLLRRRSDEPRGPLKDLIVHDFGVLSEPNICSGGHRKDAKADGKGATEHVVGG